MRKSGHFQLPTEKKNPSVLVVSCCMSRVKFHFVAGLDCTAELHKIRYNISITEQVNKVPNRIC